MWNQFYLSMHAIFVLTKELISRDQPKVGNKGSFTILRLKIKFFSCGIIVEKVIFKFFLSIYASLDKWNHRVLGFL